MTRRLLAMMRLHAITSGHGEDGLRERLLIEAGRFLSTDRARIGTAFLDTEGPFMSVDEAQAAVDAWVEHYNADRPHQALDEKVPVTPADRFAPVPAAQRSLVDLWLPPALEGETQ